MIPHSVRALGLEAQQIAKSELAPDAAIVGLRRLVERALAEYESAAGVQRDEWHRFGERIDAVAGKYALKDGTVYKVKHGWKHASDVIHGLRATDEDVVTVWMNIAPFMGVDPRE